MKPGVIITILNFLYYVWVIEGRDIYVGLPNVLRLGAEEKIGIAVDGMKNRELVEIFVQDHPGRKTNLTQSIISLSPGKPEIATLIIEPQDVDGLSVPDTKNLVYVCLIIHGNGFHKEAIVPLSMKSGYLYIQTDKPIYTPKQNVQFRIIQLNEEGKPTNGKIRLQIINPNNVVVRDTSYGGKRLSELFITPAPFQFSSYPLLGRWSATVLYGYKFQQNSTVEFEVQEYVLPTFTVKLDLQEVILPSETVIPVEVTAKYLYGKSVKGIVSFKFGVKGEAPNATFFGISDSNELNDGKYLIKIDVDDLKRHNDVGWFPKIEGFHFVVEAIVIDTATGQKEIVRDTKGVFTSTPVVITFKRTLKDFKPGISSTIEADLKYVNGRPASNIKTIISGSANGNLPLEIYNTEFTSDNEGRAYFEIHPHKHHEIVEITVKTNDLKLGDNQASGSFKRIKYVSQNKAYISIGKGGKESMKPGDRFLQDITIQPGNCKKPMTDIYFLVISKGKIILMKKLVSGQKLNSRVEFQVTYEMVPSFRILVLSHCDNELITDSRKVDVVNMCDSNTEVTMEPKFLTKEPGASGKIALKGPKGTSVGLLGIDSGVYALNDQGLLTESKVFKDLEARDLGCGPGGGWTTDDVLGNAGIIIITNHYTSQSESSCKEKIRRKRELYNEKVLEYHTGLHDCCKLGMKEDLYHRTCEARAEIVMNVMKESDKNCSQTFLDCCLYNKNKKLDMIKQMIMKGPTPRNADDYSELVVISEDDEKDLEALTNVRIDFRETWIFKNFVIGATGEIEHHLSLPHSITTWVIQGVSLSSQHGMCIIPPKELKSMKNVFVQLNLPYSVIRNEQIEIKATVFNYGGRTISAVVYMYGVKDLCSGFQEGEKSERKRLLINAHSAESVYFPVIPLQEGNYDIKVVALSPIGSDIVIRQLNVLPEGQPEEKHIPVILDPSNQQKRSKRNINTNTYSDVIDETQNVQVTAIKLRIPENTVPGTEACVISALGDQFGPTVETSLENPEALLEGPRGCGEQNMIFFAPTIYTMRYLKSVGHITAERESKGYDLIRKGYSHQLNYRKNDGSFGAYLTTPSSVWLTAFVTRVFCEASELVYIDKSIMCSGVIWLLNKQNADGSFQETNPVYHKDMMGGVNGKIPLTAYVLLTFETCSCDIDTTIPKAQAVEYLEEHLDGVTDPLPTAIVAYALSLSDSNLKVEANDKLLSLGIRDIESNTLHWGSGSAAANIEATSYSLLTQLKFSNMLMSNAIVNWLNTQRFYSGKFQSTQDTIIALNALSEYAIKAKTPGIDLNVNITASHDRNFFKSFQFDEGNARILQEVKVDKLGGLLFVNTAGHGVGLLSVKLKYNLPTPPEKLCKFDIKVNVSAAKEKRVLNENYPPDSQNNDYFGLFEKDLIRAAENKLDQPPQEEIQFEIDPRNRQQRSSRLAKSNDKGELLFKASNKSSSRLNRADKRENSAVILNVHICVKYLGDREAGTSIVDVGVFSGFEPIEEDLKQLELNYSSLIDRYETTGKGVLFYLEKIPHTETHCFQFRILQKYIVGNTQTSVIKVFDYYNPDESCTLFYRPDNNSPLLKKICENGICQCASGGCPPKNPLNGLKRDELLVMACEEHDYVWKGRIKENIQKHDGFLRIKFLVSEVLKSGIESADVVEGEVRNLLARDNCDSAELHLGREYLIMGTDGNGYENEEGVIWYRYMLDKSTKIQMWLEMTKVKGPDKTLQKELRGLSNTLKKNGCES